MLDKGLFYLIEELETTEVFLGDLRVTFANPSKFSFILFPSLYVTECELAKFFYIWQHVQQTILIEKKETKILR